MLVASTLIVFFWNANRLHVAMDNDEFSEDDIAHYSILGVTLQQMSCLDVEKWDFDDETFMYESFQT